MTAVVPFGLLICGYVVSPRLLDKFFYFLGHRDSSCSNLEQSILLDCCRNDHWGNLLDLDSLWYSSCMSSSNIMIVVSTRSMTTIVRILVCIIFGVRVLVSVSLNPVCD
jgi:hypothetical protein